MATAILHHAAPASHCCPDCEPYPPLRNHWFLGKLVTPRDLTDEHRHIAQKLRLHHQRLHGTGIVCGLEIRPHENPQCQDRLVHLEPGSAIDCCGHDILVLERDCIDLEGFPAFRELRENPGEGPHRLRLCLRYRECPTEQVPVLFDECACDDSDCAPNRILESYAVELVVDPPEPEAPAALQPRLRWLATAAAPAAMAVALDEAGRLLLTLSSDAQALVYRTAFDGLAPQPPVQLQQEGQAVAADPARKLLLAAVAPATAGDPRELRVYDLAGSLAAPERMAKIPDSAGSPVLLRLLPATGEVVSLAVTGGKLALWKAGVPDQAPLRSLDLGGDATGLALGSGGTLAYTLRKGPDRIVEARLDGGTPETRDIALPAGFAPAALDAVLSTAPDLVAVVGSEAGKGQLRLMDPAGAGTALGGPVELAHPPTALAVSPGGRWGYVVQAEAGKSWLQPVNLHLLRAGRQPKAGTALELPGGVAGIAIGEGGRRLWLPYPGGVIVVEVDEADCGALLDSGDCPACVESDCLTLATIRGWRPGAKLLDGTGATGTPPAGVAWIDNADGRVVLASTQAIAAALRCLLEQGPGAGGAQGPPGQDGADGQDGQDGLGIDAVAATFVPCEQPGSAAIQQIGGQRTLVLQVPRGCDGKDGAPGGGLEEKLIRIGALSWTQRRRGRLVPIGPLPDGSEGLGLVIEFTGPVMVGFTDAPGRLPDEVDADHVFQVLARPREPQDRFLDCRCPLAGGRVFPAEVTGKDGDGVITGAKVLPGPAAPAAAYVLSREALDRFNGFERQELWAVLRGDFVREATGNPDDPQPGRAIDAEFVRGELPTGDRPSGSPFGIQGGTFESWFTVRQG
jgi:hypothetical protein